MTTLEPWDPDDGAARVRILFSKTYAGQPDVVTSAPGRVNLIGEHTDYNAGLCLPIALPHATYAAARTRDDDRVRLVSGEQGKVWEGDLARLSSAEDWAAYAGGVVWALGEAGRPVTGIDVAVESCVPSGAGVSSSAALECSVGLAVLELLGVPDGSELRRGLADAGIRAEAEVAGAPTGGMDQTIAVLGRPDNALLLDCRSWETRQVPFDPPAADLGLLVVDTRVHHAHSDGGYAERRAECAEATRRLGLTSLREASVDDLGRLDDELIRRRARHVVTEIARVTRTVRALDDGDWPEVGRLMLDSHTSMRDDFEVSCPELDQVVATAIEHGAAGARMTGGGFGGSAIALVPTESLHRVRTAIDDVFAERSWRRPTYLPAPASAAARVIR
ncbi:MAG: galactokinase [Actinomycetota bacterium]|nr:galactokinase [Actinomycetota bacterium]